MNIIGNIKNRFHCIQNNYVRFNRVQISYTEPLVTGVIDGEAGAELNIKSIQIKKILNLAIIIILKNKMAIYSKSLQSGKRIKN